MTNIRHLLILSFAVLLLLSALLVVIVPTSKDFVVRALVIGSLSGVLSWKLVANDLQKNYVISITLILVLGVGGFYWSRDHAFGAAYKIANSLLCLEFLVVALTAFAASVNVLVLQRSRNGVTKN